jgi:hypothetical protein
MLTHNDKPTDENGFDSDNFIQGIATIIKDCTPPKGIAINGYWGMGKTSALLQLYKALTGASHGARIPEDSEIVPVWFEAWRYQHEATPIVALLHEVRAAFNLWNKVLEKSGDMLGITFLGVLGAFDETIKAASGGVMSPKFGDIPKVAADYEKERYRNHLASQDISNLLEAAIDKALGNKNKKLVIFIDDLDRCNPEAALKLLEGIKVYLNLKNCVIVFAIDQRQIERALKKALAIDDGSDGQQAREYLEKICQDIYHLPLPDKQRKAEYLESLLKGLTLNNNDVIPSAYRAQIKSVAERFDCLPANPRKIKALANRLGVVLRHNEKLAASAFIKANSLPRQYELLLATTVIYTFHRELHEQLEKNPEYIQKVSDYAATDPSEADMKSFYVPMKGIIRSMSVNGPLPTNPSDSHVFRLHTLFASLGTITEAELKPFLGI